MAYFQVEGGHRLHGEITPQGAKNEALQILCATLLTPRRVVVHNVPRILDVMQLIDLLRAMGVEVEQLADDTYAFCAREIDLDYLLTEDYRRRCARLRGELRELPRSGYGGGEPQERRHPPFGQPEGVGGPDQFGGHHPLHRSGPEFGRSGQHSTLPMISATLAQPWRSR